MPSAPKYTFCVKGRHWYFRSKATGVRPLPGQPGESDFHRAYSDLLKEREQVSPLTESTTAKDSFRWLVAAFERSPEYRLLKPNTQRDYSRHLGILLEKAGGARYASFTKSGVMAVRNAFAETPRKANYMVQVISLVLTWAVDQGLIKENPVLGVKKLKAKGVGYKPWTEGQITHFLTNGKPSVVLGVVLGLYTGQRLGDVVSAKREHYVGGDISVRQNKTGEFLEIAAAAPLRDALQSRPYPNAVTLVTKENGEPFPSEGAFSNQLKREIRRLGMDDELSFHGLRYAAAARLEEAGCSMGVIISIIGHRTYQMAVQYATKRRGAAEAARVYEGLASDKS